MKTLIVDNINSFNILATGVLCKAETELQNATNGEQAIIAINNGDFDCIFISKNLDDIDGIELCKKIRSRDKYRHIPILLLTDRNESQLIKQASTAGITDIFEKTNTRELCNYIERFSLVKKPIKGKILYIEDDKSQSIILEHMLKSRQLEVDTFEYADEAWNAFLNNDYDLIISDIVLMGEMSGVMLINKIRRIIGEKGKTPILAITGYDDISRRISLYNMGINDYITKPVIEEELISRIRNLISMKRNNIM